ncbi:IclR family transcriptional regulator [Fodinicola feengrottensis]|uniref:IclR family transcriptional regulator n=1 Tax=Fodinicola feengrottensis TaxID=435914 RepID=A0ABP4RM72_9ACTN
MTRAVPAVTRALDILELFLTGEALSAPDICGRSGLPRTTVHELLHTLLDRDFLATAPERPNHYRLGVRVFQLGGVFAGQLDLARDGQPIAAAVAARCAETVHLAVLDGVEVVYVVRIESTQPVRMVSSVGRRLPAHCTAVGKVLLAELAPAELDLRYRRRKLTAMTPRSITTLAALKKETARIREAELATEFCESNEAVACVAAPVRDHQGETVAAMSISVPITRWNAARSTELAAIVRDGARQLSGRLGFAIKGT